MAEEIHPLTKFWGKHNKINHYKNDKITDAYIGKKIGVSEGSIRKIRTGCVNIYLHRIVQIAEVLDCHPSELLPQEWQAKNFISMQNAKDIADVFDIIDAIEREKNVKLPNDLRAKIFIGAYMQLTNRADNENSIKEDVFNYTLAFLDGVINQ